MFSEGKTEIYIGIVVFTALILLIFGIIWGKRLPIFSQYKVYNAVFGNAQGVEKGDPVMVHGIKKGEITDIILLKDKVMIEFRIDRDVVIFSDAQVYLEIEELIGGKQLSVFPGNSNLPLEKDETLMGENKGDIRIFMAKSIVIMDKVDSLLSTVNNIVRRNKIKHLISNLEQVSFQTKELLKENRKNISSTISTLNSISMKFQADSTLDNINTTLDNLSNTVVLLDTTITLLHPVIERLKNEQSTFGKMTGDKIFYEQLVSTTNSLDSLIKDIKKNPRKYLHFSLF